MQQTLLVLLGVIVLGIFSLARHQSYAQQEDTAITREVETAVLGIFDRWKGHLLSLPFDECQTLALGDAGDCQETYYGLGSHPNFSAALRADASEVSFDDFDDFDDFSGYDQTHEYLVQGQPMTFRVRLDSARYVDPTEPWVQRNAPTVAKQLTLSVSYEATRADGGPTRTTGMSQAVTVTADGSNF